MPTNGQDRPVLLLLGSHWVSMLGVTLVTLAGCSWLIALPLHINGRADDPYIGLLIFIAIPIVFFLGLALIPIGIALAKRRLAANLATLPDRATAWRRLVAFFLVGTVINLIIGSQLTYRAVSYMETRQFCGQSCHVMKPQFTAWSQVSPHKRLECVSCHVAPGASGWFQSKIAGTRQFAEVVLDSYSRPIPSALESNRLTPAADTCEHCHAPEWFFKTRLRILTEFNSDEANTPSYTVLSMRVGGGAHGGIHGAHMGPGVHIRYAATDKKRQNIPWVESRNTNTGMTRTYLVSDTSPDAIRTLPTFDMQCFDCHNRTGHDFELPERALDSAISLGEITTSLPFVRKKGLELLRARYASNEEASQKIPESLATYYRQSYPQISGSRDADIRQAGNRLAAIYNGNVFPDLKVDWGTYPNNLGHMDFPGCFRCHDGSHSTTGGASITQDCGTCHDMVAVSEASPQILDTLGITKTSK